MYVTFKAAAVTYRDWGSGVGAIGVSGGDDRRSRVSIRRLRGGWRGMVGRGSRVAVTVLLIRSDGLAYDYTSATTARFVSRRG